MKRVFLAMVLCASLLACARARPVVRPTSPALSAAEVSLVDLVRMVNDSYAGVERLKGSISLTATGLRFDGSKKCRGHIALERPGKLRLKAYRALAPSLFEVVADGDRFWVHIPSEGKVYTGEMTARLPRDGSVWDLSPSEIIDALAPGAISLDDPSTPVVLERQPNSYILHLLERRGERLVLAQKIWVRQSDLSVHRRQFFDDDGALRLEVLLSDFKHFGGARFPATVALQRYGPGEDVSIVLEFQKVQLNVSLNPKVFTFSIPLHAEVVQIDDASEVIQR